MKKLAVSYIVLHTLIVLSGCVSNSRHDALMRGERMESFEQGRQRGLYESDGSLYGRIHACQSRLAELILSDKTNVKDINFEKAAKQAGEKTDRDFCLMGYNWFCKEKSK